jgi:hypothetical protein
MVEILGSATHSLETRLLGRTMGLTNMDGGRECWDVVSCRFAKMEEPEVKKKDWP